MEPFIQVAQYHFIQEQGRTIVQAKVHSTDKGVVQAIREMAVEKIADKFSNLNDDQKQILIDVKQIEDKEDLESFLGKLKKYVIPFPMISEHTVEKAFPKVKKLKQPDLKAFDLQEVIYLRWEDLGTNRTYMLIPKQGKLVGVSGFLEPSIHKGICSICGGLDEVSLFTVEKKGRIRGTYSKKGNYICKNASTCNHHIKDINKLHSFLENLQ